MSQYHFTVATLRDGVRRYVMTPEQARQNLLEIRGLIDELLVCGSDAKRIRLYNKFLKRLILGWASPDSLLFWSKIANP